MTAVGPLDYPIGVARLTDGFIEGLLYNTSGETCMSYQRALLAAGGRRVGGVDNMRLLWDAGVPASYAVACLVGGASVEQTIARWGENIPAEFASVL